MSEAYVLLNVNFKKQAEVIEKLKSMTSVRSIKSVYGIYDILVIFESDKLYDIKNEIDSQLHQIDGIENLTTLISISTEESSSRLSQSSTPSQAQQSS